VSYNVSQGIHECQRFITESLPRGVVLLPDILSRVAKIIENSVFSKQLLLLCCPTKCKNETEISHGAPRTVHPCNPFIQLVPLKPNTPFSRNYPGFGMMVLTKPTYVMLGYLVSG
jgi:hypothetical protein